MIDNFHLLLIIYYLLSLSKDNQMSLIQKAHFVRVCKRGVFEVAHQHHLIHLNANFLVLD